MRFTEISLAMSAFEAGENVRPLKHDDWDEQAEHTAPDAGHWLPNGADGILSRSACGLG
jgi:hypothetical protein